MFSHLLLEGLLVDVLKDVQIKHILTFYHSMLYYSHL